MKKLILYISLIILLISGGCTEKKIYRIGISQCSSDDWRNKMNEEVMREAMLHNDVEIEIRSADDDSQKQIKDLQYFAANNFDVIVVAPNEAGVLTPAIEEIYNQGIPIVIFDRDINSASYTQRIGVDNSNIGKMAADYAISLLGDSIKAIEIYGLPGSTPAEDRHKGFGSRISLEGGRIVASAPANWLQEKAEIVADSMIRLYPEANLVFAHNDRMAIGAAIVAQRSGKTNLKIIGIDAAPGIGVKAVADSLIDATFLYPTEGHLILREAVKIAKGESVEREIILPNVSAVDASNADILLLQNEMLEEDTRKVEALKSRLDDFMDLHHAQTALVYAVIAILILLFGILFLVLRTFWSHRRHQAALLNQNRLLEEERDKQKELNERLEEATQSKLVFFTNVSHDLRTPLTLIAEPVAQLKNADNLNLQQSNLVRIADKNVKILQRLINQILDFRKFENNKLKINLSEVDFNNAVKEWTESFISVAKKRDIRLHLTLPDPPVILAIDVEKIERVFFNLISNALKYSPDNSDININVSEQNTNLILKVADTGEGISREDLVNIFDRFFQVDRVRPKGSGIGLSLAKAFVELHGGTITVESEIEKGSVFTVIIPITHVAENPVDVTSSFMQEDVNAELDDVESEKDFDENKPLLLIIDDNKDIRVMVSELMKEDYNIVTAADGKEGIRKATKYVPDLIICDVMMPGIDGMEVCSILKKETITSHIPVLMLTACTLDEQRVQGFDSGADGYLSKPFSWSVLRSQSASLIANRKRIKDVLENNITVKHQEKKEEKKSKANVDDIDNEFYGRFLSLFENNMGNPDLSVETIASELGFERTQFYRKIKAITNYSPVELMRNLRLKKARTLLKTTEKTVSEICYEVGFSTPAYFTKCYREQYGETPSETRS